MVIKNRISELAQNARMTGTELAKRLNIDPHKARRYMRGETPLKADMASQIADIFGVSVEHVMGFGGADDPGKQSKLPLYGTAQGGIGSDISDMSYAIDHLDRPDFLKSSPNAYCVYVTGESMEPRYYAGEIVYVNPARPIRRNDYAVIQTHDDDGHHAMIKRYISASDDKVVLEQLNPDKRIELNKNAVEAIHFVQGAFIT
jgi:SOS-response transcriptional repressor LexA